MLTGLFKVLECDVVYRKKADSGAVFRTHVGDGGSVGSGELRHSRTEKLHKPPTDTSLAQVLNKHRHRNTSLHHLQQHKPLSIHSVYLEIAARCLLEQKILQTEIRKHKTRVPS